MFADWISISMFCMSSWCCLWNEDIADMIRYETTSVWDGSTVGPISVMSQTHESIDLDSNKRYQLNSFCMSK